MSNAPEILLVGDASAGLRYVPFAKSKIVALRATGETLLFKVYEIETAEIHIRITPQGDKVTITVPYPCPNVNFSGFMDTFEAKLRSPNHTPQYLITEQLAAEYRLPRALGAPVPTAKLMSGVRPISSTATLVDGLKGDAAPISTQGVDGDIFSKTGTRDVYQKELGQWYQIQHDGTTDPLLTTRLPVEATVFDYVIEYGDPLGTPQASIDYSKFKETYQHLMPSRFTGLMRQVVQATFATQSWRSFATTETPTPKPAAAPVNYQANDSWGCVSHNKKHYFIQITQEAVYFVPTNHCAHKVKINGIATDVVILRAADTSKKVKIGTIPSGIGGSWGNEIGWAFSYTQPEASIVYASSTFVGSFEYKTTSLLTLTFGFDGQDKLTTATLSRTEPKIFYHPVFMNKSYANGGHALFNSVAIGASGHPENVTIDFGLQALGWPTPPNYVADKIPVYVYYTHAGKQLCTYSYRDVAAQSTTTTKPAARAVLFYNTSSGTYSNSSNDESAAISQRKWGTETNDGYTDWGFSCADVSTAKASGGVNNSTTEWAIGEFRNYRDDANAARLKYVTYRYMNFVTPSAPVPMTVTYGWRPAPRRKHDSTTIIISKSGGGVALSASLTLPVNDRECALLWQTATTAAITGTQGRYFGPAYVIDSTEPKFEIGPSPSKDGWGDIEAAVRLDFKISRNITCGGSQEYFIDFSAPETPTMKYVDTGEYASQVIEFTAGSSPSGYNYMQDWYSPGPNTSACGDISYSPPSNQGPLYDYRYGEDQSLSVQGSSVTKLTLFSHNAPMEMTQGTFISNLYSPTPQSGFTLAYNFVQAAFDPSNYLKNKGDIVSGLVVKVGANTYDVRHQLSGWLGVV